jgi:hypothetical protein
MRRFIAMAGFAIAALLAAVTPGGCMMSGDLAATAGGWTESDDDTDDPASTPLDSTGDVAAAQSAEPCVHDAPASFTVTPPDADDWVSPALARMLLENGRAPTAEIRVHEFLSYYQADVAPAPEGALTVSSAVTDRGDGALGLSVVVAAGASSAELSVNLVLAIDTSEAMAGTRIARVRQCCVALAGALRAGDVVALSSLDGGEEILLAPHVIEGPSDPELIAHCNAIEITGPVDLTAGLETAYALANESRDGAGLNRVFVLTGGGQSPTVEDVAIAAQAVEGGPFDQVVLVGVGIGDPAAAVPYDRAELDALTTAGAGAHLLVDSADEASTAFGGRLSALTDVALLSPVLEIELPPTLAIETLDGAPIDALTGSSGADRLAPGLAAATHHTLRSCDTAYLDETAVVRIAATAADPSSGESLHSEIEAPLSELVAASSAGPSKRDAVVAYALALSASQSLAPDAAREVVETARATVLAAAVAHPGDPDLAEIGDLLDTYLALL